MGSWFSAIAVVGYFADRCGADCGLMVVVVVFFGVGCLWLVIVISLLWLFGGCFVIGMLAVARFVVFCSDSRVACCLCFFGCVWLLIVAGSMFVVVAAACLFKFALLTIYVCCGGLLLGFGWFYCAVVDGCL